MNHRIVSRFSFKAATAILVSQLVVTPPLSLYAETLNHSISNSQPLNKQELETIFGVGASQHIAAHQLNYLTKDQTQATKGKAGPLIPIIIGATLWGAGGVAGSALSGGTSREMAIAGISGAVAGATGTWAAAAAARAGWGAANVALSGGASGVSGQLGTQWGLQKAWPANNYTPSYRAPFFGR